MPFSKAEISVSRLVLDFCPGGLPGKRRAMDMPFIALFWPDMPFNALFWPRYAVQCSLFSTEVPFNALFLARKCRSMPPNILNGVGPVPEG
jgi:hypothetical protein